MLGDGLFVEDWTLLFMQHVYFTNIHSFHCLLSSSFRVWSFCSLQVKMEMPGHSFACNLSHLVSDSIISTLISGISCWPLSFVLLIYLVASPLVRCIDKKGDMVVILNTEFGSWKRKPKKFIVLVVGKIWQHD